MISAVKLDDGRRKGFGDRKNIMGDDDTPLKLGVLELSTRACKVLVVDVRNLQDGFTWSAAQNKSDITELGHLVNKDNEIPWVDLERIVLPKIRRAISFMEREDVDVFHCVAAALRGAKNREEITEKLKDILDLNIQVLDRDQEAEATFAAYRWYPPYDLTDNTVLLDQVGVQQKSAWFYKAWAQVGVRRQPRQLSIHQYSCRYNQCRQ